MLFLALSSIACVWSSAKRSELVCGDAPMSECSVKEYILPEQLTADQAGKLALAARAETKACAKRHKKLIDCIKEFQNESD